MLPETHPPLDVTTAASPADDQRSLIRQILQHQDRDSLYRLSVVLADAKLQGDGCSLILSDVERRQQVLKESTVVSQFLGREKELDPEKERAETEEIRVLLAAHGAKPEDLHHTVTLSDVEPWGSEVLDRLEDFGLTRWAFQFRCPLVIEKIHDDLRWHGRGALKCELSRDEIGSIAIVPLGIGGVLRIVRRQGKPGFTDSDLEWLKWLTGELESCMGATVSLTDLMDLGTKLEIDDFGRTLVQLLQKELDATGCSIFLELEPDPRDNLRSLSCIATTGFYDKQGPVDKERIKYTVDMNKEETDSLTSWVVRHGRHLSLDSSDEYDRSEYPGIRRPGPGRSNETDPLSAGGGPILISPLFLHHGKQVAGAIRLIRPPGHFFKSHEQLLFLDISRRLNKVLTNLQLRRASERLIKLFNDPSKMLRTVPVEVCRLLGVEGCSVFRKQGQYLCMAATVGNLQGREGEVVYDLEDHEAHGWTGWVARRKKPLRLRYPAEARELFPTDPPQHSDKLDKPCEIKEVAYRFLAVPIFRTPEDPSSEVLGVIRVPRGKDDLPFEESDQVILQSFASRLSLALSLASRNEQLKAVVRVSELGEPVEDPGEIANKVAAQAVEVLIDKIGFDFAAIFKLNPQTDQLDLFHGGSTSGEVVPAKRQGYPIFALLDKEHGVESHGDTADEQAAIGAGKGTEIHGWHDSESGAHPIEGSKVIRYIFPIELGSRRLGSVEAGYVVKDHEKPIGSRQKDLVGLLAGFCASALYGESVYAKLHHIREGLERIGRGMTADSSLKVRLEKIASAAASVTLADNVIILEHFGPNVGKQASGGRIRESACGGPKELIPWTNRELDTDAAPVHIIRDGTEKFEHDTTKKSKIYKSQDDREFISKEGILSSAALPLIVGDMHLGCVFFNFTSHLKFNPQEKQEIRLMAEYAAVAIYQVRLLEEKSNLLRYADHSLRQPLNSLQGYLDNLADGVYREELLAEIKSDSLHRGSRFAQRAAQQHRLCQYMGHLIDTFLNIDKIEAQLLRAAGPSLSLGDLFRVEIEQEVSISNTCSLAANVADAYIMGFSPIRREIQGNVLGDFDTNAIKMSVLNILVNAIKYGRSPDFDRDFSVIEFKLFTFEKSNADWVAIQVDDAGTGIPKTDREAIFERGYRREGRTIGLGVGLFLTRGYIAAHGGEVWAEDSHLGGTRFVVHLPKKRIQET